MHARLCCLSYGSSPRFSCFVMRFCLEVESSFILLRALLRSTTGLAMVFIMCNNNMCGPSEILHRFIGLTISCAPPHL